MEKQLFIFGKPVEGDSFTDREKETERLVSNFRYGINSFLISPRRWGKTSLIKKVMKEAESETLKTVFVDVFKCRTAVEFSEALASAVLSQTASKMDEFIENAKSFLGRLNFDFDISPDPMNSIGISLGVGHETMNIKAALEVPAKVAKKKGIRIVVCIDEFQQIGEFADSMTFQKELRSIWQHQQDVSYCLFGSKKHMMESLFDDESKPFYKFGDIIYLKKIPLNYWIDFISGKFTDIGKRITEEQIRYICEIVDYQSSYVQQLCWYVVLYSSEIVMQDNIDMAIEELVVQNAALFESKTENLTSYQMHFLRALSAGVNCGFSSSAVIERYKLGSSAHVAAVKKSLLEKNMIYVEDGRIFISDPVLGLWLNR